MSRIRLISCLLPASLLLCAGCRLQINEGVRGDGEVVTVTRDLGDVHAVELRNQGDLSIALGDREALTIRAEGNLVELIEAEVEDGTLVLRTRPGVNLRPTRPIRYELTVRSLTAIRDTGSGDITAPRLRSPAMEVELSGSGDLDLQGLESGACTLHLTGSGDVKIGELRADELAVRQSGSGDVEIGAGGAERFTARLSGSGDCRAADFRAGRARVDLSGSGGVDVHVEDALEGRLSGSGGVSFGGDPEVDVKASGSGRARRR